MLLFYCHTSSYGLDIPFCIIVFKGLLNEIVNSIMSWPPYSAAFTIKGINYIVHVQTACFITVSLMGFKEKNIVGFL